MKPPGAHQLPFLTASTTTAFLCLGPQQGSPWRLHWRCTSPASWATSPKSKIQSNSSGPCQWCRETSPPQHSEEPMPSSSQLEIPDQPAPFQQLPRNYRAELHRFLQPTFQLHLCHRIQWCPAAHRSVLHDETPSPTLTPPGSAIGISTPLKPQNSHQWLAPGPSHHPQSPQMTVDDLPDIVGQKIPKGLHDCHMLSQLQDGHLGTEHENRQSQAHPQQPTAIWDDLFQVDSHLLLSGHLSSSSKETTAWRPHRLLYPQSHRPWRQGKWHSWNSSHSSPKTDGRSPVCQWLMSPKSPQNVWAPPAAKPLL